MDQFQTLKQIMPVEGRILSTAMPRMIEASSDKPGLAVLDQSHTFT